MAQGPDGNLYQLTIYPGTLSRIAVSDGNRAPTAVITAEPTNGLSPLEVAFSAIGSTDPEGKPLTYEWEFGDGTFSTERNPVKTYESATVNTYTVTLTVTDGLKTGQATTLVTVGSTVPQITEIGTSVGAGTVGELLAVLSVRPDLARVLTASSLLVDGGAVRREDADRKLATGSTVDVLPPFAGG